MLLNNITILIGNHYASLVIIITNIGRVIIEQHFDHVWMV